MRLRPLVPLAALAAAALVPAAAPAATARSAPPRVELLATATDGAGRVTQRRRVRLETLERPDVTIVRRTPSTITVARTGSGASGPRATFRVRIVPGATDVLAHVRAAVPSFTTEGSVSGFETQTGTPIVLSAYRTALTRSTDGRFPVRAVAAAQLRGRYGDLRGGLVELRVDGRSAVGANSFPVVPGQGNTLRSFAGGTPR